MQVIEGEDDRYAVLAELGPRTVLARAESTEREVILKRTATPPPDVLFHPHLPVLYESFAGYAVFERVDGTSLATLAAQGRALRSREIEAWHGQVLDVLQYMHVLGIAHGDVSAENVLICADRETFLVDGALEPGTPERDLEQLERLLSLVRRSD